MDDLEDKIAELICESIKAGYIKETNTGKAINKKVIYSKFKKIESNTRKVNELLIKFNVVEIENGRATKSVYMNGKKRRCMVVSDNFINKHGFIF